jgi:hypothetical protein
LDKPRGFTVPLLAWTPPRRGGGGVKGGGVWEGGIGVRERWRRRTDGRMGGRVGGRTGGRTGGMTDGRRLPTAKSPTACTHTRDIKGGYGDVLVVDGRAWGAEMVQPEPWIFN